MQASNFSILIQITILHSLVSFYFPAIQTEPPLWVLIVFIYKWGYVKPELKYEKMTQGQKKYFSLLRGELV